ncbi:MAG: hypothetical protein FJX57_14145, partial [Alphaproteobacteria bacterium]|nr:hypothetical protein [Alphaproteobacteria bacterium]
GGEMPRRYADADATFCTARLTPRHCAQLLHGASPVRRFELQMPLIPQRPRPLPAARPGRGRAPAKSVGRLLIGIVDSGCNFAHAHLRRARGGTRVLNLWLQDDHVDPRTARLGGAPPGFGYGVQLDRTRLDSLIAEHTRAGFVDEAALYEAAGMKSLRARAVHGGAILDLLAGPRLMSARVATQGGALQSWDLADDACAEADVVFVSLPRDIVQDSSSAALTRHLIDGLAYILDCAGPRTERIVLNVSDGSSRGSHDGRSIVELAMAEIAARRRGDRQERFVVLASGNSFDEGRHACIDRLRPGRWESLTLRLAPESEAPSQLIVRVPHAIADAEIRVVAPGAEPDRAGRDVVRAGQAKAWPDRRAPECAVIYPSPGPEASTEALITFAPTATDRADTARAVAGEWRIEIRSRRGSAEAVHLWVTRSQRNLGAQTRGRQARFIDKSEGGVYDPARHLNALEDDPIPSPSPIRRRGSLNSLATGPAGGNLVVVGSGFVRPTRGTSRTIPTTYSSTGPAVAARPRQGPELLAPTDQSRTVASIVTAGTIANQRIRIRGSSFAAPQAAREIAEIGARAITAPRPASLLIVDDPTRSRLSPRNS